MVTEKSDLPFLVLHPYALSREKARAAVIDILRRCEVQTPKEGWDSLRLTWNQQQPPVSVTFHDMVAEARRTGVVERLQDKLDQADPMFGGCINEFCTPNHQLQVMTEYAGWKKEAQGPFRSACVERDLMEDILEYRRLACVHSNQHNFRLTARYFRAYLTACVSILEAFINRHILLAKHDGFSSPEFDKLQVETNLEEKVRLWWQVCSGDNPTPFFRSVAWCHLQELRTRRNEVLHAIDPIAIYAIKDLQLYLNKVRSGVGELLWQLRKAHKKPTLGFIERLRNAPKVEFQKITFRADGQHEIKVIPG